MRARLHDVLVNLAAHPVAFPAARLSALVAPVHHLPGVGLLVHDAAVAHEILGRDHDFPKNGTGSIAEVFTQAMGAHALANMDGEAHRRLRHRLGPLLSPAHVDALLAACRAPLDEAAGALAAGEEVELVRVVRTMSGRLTLAMIGATPATGVDEAAREIHALGERIASALELAPLPERRLRPVRADLDRLAAHARDALASPTTPASSLVGRLRAAGLSAEETRGVLSIFFIAGALTISVALPRLVALLVDARALHLAGADDEALARAVDEGMRYTAPVPATVRIAAHDTMVGGRRVRAGTRIVILTTNLARDARLFPDPHRFDPARVHDTRARYLWYGAGPHFCFGFPLAQRAMRLVVGELARLPGRLVVAGRRPAFGVLLPAYARLAVRLER